MTEIRSSTNSANSRNYQVGYCTNVHAGRDLPAVIENIDNYCLPIRNMVRPQSSLGVGLWFSEKSASQLLEDDNLRRLRERLVSHRLVPFTLNGFPQGDFHSEVVKHRVYHPTWWQPERLDYTLNLVKILDGLLMPGQVGSISTLPISWGAPHPTSQQLHAAAQNLLAVAESLHRLMESTGRFITLAIEPEPGCALTDSRSLRKFFQDYLSAPALTSRQSELAHRYLSVCHDVCHAAVMFEDQQLELEQMQSEGISIGKVQVSSAIEVHWHTMTIAQRVDAFEQLRSFAEDRYLHQTVVQQSSTRSTSMIEDLPAAVAAISDPKLLDDQWRIHFHVPIYLERFGDLQSTQYEITTLLQLIDQPNMPRFTGHFELETYAWGVLPKSIQAKSLCEGIAQEIAWFDQALATNGLTR
jgi:hypothetical protein